MSEMDSQDSSNESYAKLPGSAKYSLATASTSGSSTGDASSHNPIKMRIDPLQLLNCLSILLNVKGAIKSIDEVQRVAGLMGKYSKKLVSKCIYLNILQATEEPLLDEFYKETGWNLVFSWLTEAVSTKNYPLAQQILSLLLVSPISIDRLKRNNMPKMVKDLSRDCPHAGARDAAEKVVDRWKEMVKGCIGTTMPQYFTSAESQPEEVALKMSSAPAPAAAPISTEPLVTPSPSLGSGIDSSPKETSGTENSTSPPAPACEAEYIVGTDEESRSEEEAPTISTPIVKAGRGRGVSGRGSSRGTGRGRGRRKRGTSGGRGRGQPPTISYAELLCQDMDSSDNLPKEKEATTSIESRPSGPPAGECSVPPIRIAIRNGVKVLPVGAWRSEEPQRKRPSVDSTDSEDNKPLSEIRDECQKGTAPDEEEERKGPKLSQEEEKTSLKEGKKPENEKSVAEDDDDDEEVVLTKKKSKKRIIDDDDGSEEDEKMTEPFPKKSAEESPKSEVGLTEVEIVKEDAKKKKEDGKRSRETKESSEEERKRYKGREMEKKKERKDSHGDKSYSDKGKTKDRDRERSRHKASGSRDKDRDKDKHQHRDKDKKSSSKDKDRERERDRRKGGEVEDKDRRKEQQQAERDRATLDKVKPLSTEGLAKIPRKSPAAPVSFLDALGSADSDIGDAKRPSSSSSSSVVKSKSRGFRNTGILDETIKPPGIAGKRSSEVVKKPLSSGSSGPETLDLKKTKASPSSAPPAGDRPGGVKLISPKRPILSDDGGFMAALTAAGADRKKIVRKRKSSDSESKQETGSNKVSKTEGIKDSSEEGAKNEEELAIPLKVSPEDEMLGNKMEEKHDEEPATPPPTGVKPTLNFYKETLTDEPEKREVTEASSKAETEDSAAEMEEISHAEDVPTEEKNPASVETSCSDTKKDEDSMEIDELEEENGKENAIHVGEGDGERETGDAAPFGSDDEVLDESGGGEGEAPVPAPTQEEYEKIEVTFSSPKEDLKGVLVYHRAQNKRKKAVKWKTEADLKETFFFPMDEMERVNVNTIKFKEMMMMEKAREKELMFGKNRNRFLTEGAMEMGMPNTCVDFGPYKLYPVHLPNPPTVTPGCKSQEKHVQAQREHATMAAFFHPVMKPDTPTEPDPEMVQRAEPVTIPLNDVSGSDNICDNRGIPWPEPLFGPPEFPFMGASGPHQGPPQPTGGHWVLGNHSVSRFSGGPPMFAGPPGPPGPQGHGANQGGYGPPPPPQSFPGDMRGGWGAPSDFGGPPVLMPNGPHMAMPGMGGPNPGMQGGPGPGHGHGHGPGPGPGPGPGMGHMGGGPPMGNRDNYPRYRRGGGGGNWGGSQGGRGYCKHFRNGHCRHGDDCKFIHVPS